jgi:acyl carrier protein
MENMEKYNKVFVKVFNVPEERLNENFNTKTVDKWDSIMHLSLMTEIEDEFDIMFDSEDILGFLSYNIGKEILAKYDIVI